MLKKFGSVFRIAAVIGFASVACRHLAAQTAITQPVNDFDLVALPGNTHALATQTNDRGPVPDGTLMAHVWLQLKRPADTEKSFIEFLNEQQDPQSPNYHKWLTAKQLGEQFGPYPHDIEAVTQWLQRAGFTVNSVYPRGTLIDFSGTVGQVRQAFHTEIHNFDVNGENHYANVSDPRIPAALEPVIAGPVSLNNFMPRHTQSIKGMKPKYTSGGSFPVVPGDLATIYNFSPAFAAGTTGTGVEIVVVENTDVYTSADFGVFSKEFGLARPYPQASFKQIHPAYSGSGSGQTCSAPGYVGNNGAEAILDAEWAHAAAPNASIVLASCADTSSNFGGFIALENLLSDGNPIPQVVSISYGGPESGEPMAFNAYINSLYSSAAAAGVSIFVSTGDSGSDGFGGQESTHGISVSSFATTPYNVAVGGTDFGDVANHIPSSTYWSNTNGTYFNSALSYIPEIPWNDSCASQLIAAFEGYATTYGSTGFCNSGNFLNTVGGSGGPSALYTKPAFQSVSGNPADGRRDIPDVSLFAANGVWGHAYVICYSDPSFSGSACTGPPNTWTEVGGTSVSSPIVAGIMALVVQKYGAPQGNPLSRIYAMARAESFAQCNSSSSPSAGNGCVFYDVTQGDNDIPCRGTLNCYTPSGTNGVLSTSNSAYQPAYRTAVGWDFATGLGTVNAFNFVSTY